MPKKQKRGAEGKRIIQVLQEAQKCWGVYVDNDRLPAIIDARRPAISRFRRIVESGSAVSIEPITILRLPRR